MYRRLYFWAFFFCLSFFASVWFWRGRGPSDDALISSARRRIENLKLLLVERRKGATEAIVADQPAPSCRLDDLAADVQSLLQSLPFVAKVDHSPGDGSPTRRIIHLRDWHFVHRELFDIDQEHAWGRKISKEALDALYEEHLLQVELVQEEHLTILRCLIRHHGVDAVYVEGLTAEMMPTFAEKVHAMREMQKDRESLEMTRKDAEGTVQRLVAAGISASPTRTKAERLIAEVDDLLQQQRIDSLEMGVVARFLVAKELRCALPLDRAEELAKGNPVQRGRIAPDPTAIRNREKAMLDQIETGKGFAVLVLGGGHDLSKIPDQPAIEHFRMTVSSYPSE